MGLDKHFLQKTGRPYLQKIKKIISAKLDYLVLGLTIIGSMLMIFFANHTSEVGALQGVTLEIIGRLAEPWSSFRQLQNTNVENSLLRYQNAMLQIRNSQLAEAYYENVRLREMLGFAGSTASQLMPARIIGSGYNTGMATILVNLGREQGVRENMPVVSADGLVGKIISVSDSYSTVQLLTDPNFRVAALDQRSRVQAVFQWVGYDSGLLTGVSLSADVKVGDWVVTSGQNSFFSTGLKIGTVSMIDDTHAGLFQKIYVKPRLDFSRLEEVFVIVNPVNPKAGG
jgi:rod shape-determining protein MreC